MIKLLKKIGVVLGGLFLGILYIFKGNNRDTPADSPLESKKEELENKLEANIKKEAELDKNGVEKLSDKEELDYWKNNENN